MYKVTLIRGDGIGPEIVAAALEVVEATGVKIAWEETLAGEEAVEKFGTPLPEEAVASLRKNKVGLKGPLTTQVGSGYRSLNVAMRQKLDLYANLRLAKSYPRVNSPYEDIDLVVVRENTEGLYSGVEHMVGLDAAESIKIVTRRASERIVRFAFEYTRRNSRRKVTAVHKANILKFSDGLFLEAARAVAEQYPDIEYEEKIVDNMAMQLVQKPHLYDVMVMPNLYGDILSDLCAGLVGGLGMTPSGNIGDEVSLFEPVHGSAPKYKGLDRANPVAMILTAALMLRHLGEEKAAQRIERAVTEVLREGKAVTPDLNGTAGTAAMGLAIAEKVTAL
ncbi:MAG TPA: isocitrate/isopropylmalate dehydrogenase family protein [Bacillota bacterium]|jgi:isocitrate dehydrogenase (NAD+)|nr:isocitrate/isopropylmalate dehydrogenase family protein [Bacillota bacterium]HOA35378.1 isocitrate/isopropylmalate dehydrogenase family protein [Bacillota bacterium]HOL14926.1 isocitrate/isopropylmalate dehydrogenase family protein [Bacillota bacterium]HPZ11522.1 isocitrate/isopropylmalate dehydrogenase family protein [Bacillota bacterium]HQE09953.1 isocitrate/isopropylmalate dehydrogenase family protein [Bacillota bacterium]